MLDPDSLYVLEQPLPELDRPVLVHALAGFVDAGAAGRLATEMLLDTFDPELVATFDVDQLHDYRARRPLMTFSEDRWEDYATPHLAVHSLRDDAGTAFLLLTGPEPDVQWERFVAAVIALVERLDVRLTVGLHAIPMTVPHTRPTGVTAHATRRELVAEEDRWSGHVQVPGSAGALLELRLGERGHDAMGFAAHVPHYVAQSEYPDAAAVLLERLGAATGLVLPSGELREAGARTRAQIDAQVAESEEVAAVVRALEQQYDAFAGARDRANLLAGEGEDLPTADELGAAFERFLARQDGEDPKDG